METEESQIFEFLRRGKLLVRQQLELLLAEGGISTEDFDCILDAHPLTISDEKMNIRVPKKVPDYIPQNITFIEVTYGLLSRISNKFSNYNELMKELDSRGLGLFKYEDFNKFRQDLIIGTLVVRNKSLKSNFPEGFALSIDKICNKFITQYFKEVDSDSYNLFNRTWDNGLRNLDIPQIELSKLLSNRIDERIKETSRIDPSLDIGISDLLVTTEWYYWPKIAMVSILRED